MKTCKTCITGIIILAMLHQSPARAGGPVYDEGIAALASGDVATAWQLWKPLAEHGDADAQFALASLYYDGIGVAVDRTESSYWFLLAARQGHKDAQYNLGNAYKRGEGVRRSDAMAVQWWKKAAAQGLAEAQFNLALAYNEGAGVPKDEQTAARYYRQAAENGHPEALAAFAGTRRPGQPPIEKTNPPAQASSAETSPPAQTSSVETSPPAQTSSVETSPPAQASSVEMNPPARASNETGCEDWLARQSPKAYTLQLMSTTRVEDIQELAGEHDLAGYIVCSYTHEGSTRYALLIGVYPDIDTASAAAADLPPGLQAGKPWIRRFRDLMRSVARNAS